MRNKRNFLPLNVRAFFCAINVPRGATLKQDITESRVIDQDISMAMIIFSYGGTHVPSLIIFFNYKTNMSKKDRFKVLLASSEDLQSKKKDAIERKIKKT